MTDFADVVERYQGMARAYALSLLGDRGLAEDAAQEAFMDAYLHLGQLRDPAAFPGWFRRIVLKHADRQRRGRLLALELADLPGATDPLAALIEAEERRTVRDGIEALPPGLRAAITLHYQGGLSVAEVAKFLAITPGAVRKRLFDGRARLRDRLAALVTPAPIRPKPGGRKMQKLIETGIKAVDLYAPLPRGGRLAIKGERGAGQAVVAFEIVRNLCERTGAAAAFFVEDDVEQFRRGLSESGLEAGVAAGGAGTYAEVRIGEELVATIVVGEDSKADSWVTLSKDLLRSGQMPAVDALSSGTKLELAAHSTLARAARTAIEGRTLAGASMLAFLRQWFKVAEPWTGQPGEYSELEQTLAGTRKLMGLSPTA